MLGFMILRPRAQFLLVSIALCLACGSRTANETRTASPSEENRYDDGALLDKTAPESGDIASTAQPPPDAAPATPTDAAPSAPPEAVPDPVEARGEPDRSGDPCATPPKRPKRLKLKRDKTRRALGARITFTGSGHKILAKEGPDGSLRRAGDMAFHEIEVTYDGETSGSRRMNDEWTEWTAVLDFCWRGAGEPAWRPEAIEIEIYRWTTPH